MEKKAENYEISEDSSGFISSKEELCSCFQRIKHSHSSKKHTKMG